MTKTNNIPKDWKWVKLGDVCEIKSGKNQSKVINPNGKYPIYGSSGIFGYADEYICDANTTIIGRKGTINSPIYVSTKFWNVDTAFGLCSKEELESKFLFYFCLGFNFKKLDKSTTIPSLAKTDLISIPFPLPPLATQQAIVSKIEELFSELDNGIAQLKTAQQQLKTYRQSVLKWAFEGKLTEEWRGSRVRVPSGPQMLMAAEPTIKYKKSVARRGIEPIIAEREGFEPPDLPEGWKWVKFGEIHEIKSNLVDALKYLDSPHIAPDNISKGTAQLLAYNTIREDKVFSPKHKFYKGQIIYSKIRPNLAKVIIAPIDGLCSADMYPIESSLDNKFSLYYMLTSYFVSKASNTESRTILPKINQKGLNEIPFPLCSLEEQHQIVQEIESRLSVADKMEESISASLQQAEALRQSVLKRAFEGKLI